MTDSDRLKALYAKWKAKDRSHTQAYAATRMEMTQSAVSQYLLGKIALNLETLFKFRDLFGCRPEEISPSLAEAFYKTNPWRDDDPWQGMPGFETYTQSATPIEVRGKLSAPQADQVHLESYESAAGHLGISTHHGSVFAAQVEGDGLAPIARNGWFVVFSPPTSSIQAGDYVLVQSDDGRERVMEFLFERAGIREFMLANTSQRVSMKAESAPMLMPIAAIVSPSMWRKALP